MYIALRGGFINLKSVLKFVYLMFYYNLVRVQLLHPLNRINRELMSTFVVRFLFTLKLCPGSQSLLLAFQLEEPKSQEIYLSLETALSSIVPSLCVFEISLAIAFLLFYFCWQETFELVLLLLWHGLHNNFKNFVWAFLLSRSYWTHFKMNLPGNSVLGFVRSRHLK